MWEGDSCNSQVAALEGGLCRLSFFSGLGRRSVALSVGAQVLHGLREEMPFFISLV